MKKLICIIVACAMLLSLTACFSIAPSTNDVQQSLEDALTQLLTEDDATEAPELDAPETDAPEDPEEPNGSYEGEVPADFFSAFDACWTDDGDIWPTADMWASVGLPALDYKDSAVNPSVWSFGDSLSVSGWADNDTKLADLEGMVSQLKDAGIAMEPNDSAFASENEYVGYYTCNGASLKISIYTGTAEIDMYICEGRP